MTPDGKLEIGDSVDGTCRQVSFIQIGLLKLDGNSKLAQLDSSDINPLKDYDVINLIDPTAPNSLDNIKVAFANNGLIICNDTFGIQNYPLELWIMTGMPGIYYWTGQYSFGEYWSVRFKVDGTLDLSYGPGTFPALTELFVSDIGPPSDYAHLVVTACTGLSDGDLIGSGYYYADPQAENLFLAKFKPNGDLDTTFGTGGLINVPINGDNTSFSLPVYGPTGLRVQPDGSGIVGFDIFQPITNISNVYNTYLITYTKLGIIVSTVKTATDATLGTQYFLSASCILANGQFVGYVFNSPTGYLAIFNTDGTVASKINLGTITPLAQSLVGDKTSKFIFVTVDSTTSITFTRYNSDNTVDITKSFTPNSTLPGSMGQTAIDIAVSNSSGKIMIATVDTTTRNVVFYRFNPDGTVDNTYGTLGIVTGTVPSGDIGTGGSWMGIAVS